MIKIKDLLTEDCSNDTAQYGCLMGYVDEEFRKMLNDFGTKLINDKDLYIEGDEYGRENEKHCTIKYGFIPDLTREQIEGLIKDLSVFNVTISGISIFENGKKKGYDVVKFDIDSDILRKLNKAASQYPNKDEYPEYHPHMTIAYVKPQAFKEARKLNVQVPIVKVVYSPIKGEKMYFKLSEKK